VQPVQLSLLPDQLPAPPADLIGSLPQTQIGEAITTLARMIVQAAAAGVTGDE